MVFKYPKSCSAKRSSTVRHLDQLRLQNLYHVFGVMLILRFDYEAPTLGVSGTS